MKDFFPDKTLHLLIEKAWLVDTITKLGSGYLTHLSYQEGRIDPEVLTEIRNQSLGNGVLGEIIHSCGNSGHRVAMVEVAKVNDFQDFIRFDLRLLGVIPFIRDGLIKIESRYSCYYH